MSYISCENLAVGYEGQAVANGISFSVEKGDYLCILGENGSGKSTLMKTILGLQEPLSGEIKRGDGLQKGEIGYLPQQTVVQKDFPASVQEIVQSGVLGRSKFRPFYTKEEKQLAKENMERMDILDLAGKCYRDLSGGQQQRVLLARAMCATRKVLLLDEPVTGLDPHVTAELYQVIEKLNKEGVTIIMISHDIESAITYGSKILHIGRKNFFGTTEEYKSSKIGKYYLEQEEKEVCKH